MESWYTKLFSMTLVKVKMHLEGLNGWNEIVKPKKLKVIVWQRKLESHLTFFSKPNKTCNYQYCKWWLYIISNQPQQPAVQINLILATHFGDGTDLRRSPHELNHQQQCNFQCCDPNVSHKVHFQHFYYHTLRSSSSSSQMFLQVVSEQIFKNNFCMFFYNFI